MSSLSKALCVFGILHGVLASWALWNANIAINRLLKNWLDYLKRTHQKEEDQPPIWGWVKVEQKEPHKMRVPHAPWLALPLSLIGAWFYIWLRIPIPLEPPWQALAEDNLKQALMHERPEEAKQAIATLAYIHGDFNAGIKVFNDYCADCHDPTKSKDQTIPRVYKLEDYSRKQIISGILYPNPHNKVTCMKVTREQEVTCMKYGITTLLSPKQIIDVIEYIKPAN